MRVKKEEFKRKEFTCTNLALNDNKNWRKNNESLADESRNLNVEVRLTGFSNLQIYHMIIESKDIARSCPINSSSQSIIGKTLLECPG